MLAHLLVLDFKISISIPSAWVFLNVLKIMLQFMDMTSTFSKSLTV
jgi:hypothetical protein